ncbi:non-specific serine/threonine protein kinase [Halopolyspora algeriensis]|uniref:Non-specific serine/threonine protein kinase n=1 Tax=Halopolyspora algeriensis TaxID=1500506 RepID=A0A368VNV0_9ACTN|nr:LuxR C-terminal-related transcriptional regulator [Halopolyspora algeriensis]RCW43198.1 non-specific serine/threonine protein kinase [Halopolyspora algeriensis]TQM56257.1 non-specific serine/threonine protein kinase [Halopolyspora algeriensis]
MEPSARTRARQAGGNLPVDVTSFVGRRREITLTKRMLAESRVVTLTGPGGIGKSRLALRVASSMRRVYRDKAWLVELGELTDPALLADTISEQLQLGNTTSGNDVDTLIEYLGNREMLLVLDNCEHLVAECALLVDALIRACPGVRILVTSRQSLGIAGESTVVVPPLQVPDPDDLPPAEAYEQYAAVRLFVERAKAVLPEFEPSAEDGAVLMRLCHHLDGNPLAIELAVVRLRSLSLYQLEERLAERYELLTEGRRGAPARQQTLRALIDWSWDLCSEQDRRAWAHASVFFGSFDLDAAEHVISATAEPAGVPGVVHSLVDKSILMREQENGESRYRLPHALREYGQEKLDAAGERADVEHRHRDWYAGLVERFAAEWIGPEQVSWVNRLLTDHANLQAALHSALAEHAPQQAVVALRMATRLGQYWGIRGLHGEARHWLDRALAVAAASPQDRASGLRANSWLALLQGDIITASPQLDEAALLAQQEHDEVEHAHVALTRGMAALFQGQLTTADDLIGTALADFRRHAAAHGELFALFGLGTVRGFDGRPEEGLALLSECVDTTTRLGDVFWRSYALWGVAHIELSRHAFGHAETATKDALGLQRRMGNRLAMAFSIDTLAWIAQERDRSERAAELFGAAAGMWEATRAAPAFYAPFAAEHDRYESRTRAILGAEEYRSHFDRGYRLSTDAALDLALETKRHTRAHSRDNVHPMPLTRREREIADLVAQGRTNKEIAENLFIAQRTVEGHVQHILTKLDFTSRAQIAGWVAGQPPSDSSQ